MAEAPRKRRTRRRIKRPLNHEPSAVTYAREKAGLKKYELAERVGISPQLMGEIESGWRNCTPENLAKMAEALNCPLVVLEAKRQADSTPTAPEPVTSVPTQVAGDAA